MLKLPIRATALAAISALTTTPLAALPANRLGDLVGRRANAGEEQMQARGFTFIDGNAGGYSRHAYWWHERDRNCVHVETSEGRFAAITDATPRDCNRGGGNAGTAIAVGAGALLLGALLSHRSHHHDDRQHNDDAGYEQDYERGFNDGLHNSAYHNNNRADGYSRGYQAGVEQRSHNLAHRRAQPERGGYHPSVEIADLTDARASSADDELRRRGFNNVDGFSSGGTVYGIWSRPQTHQCVQMTVAEGRVVDIRDIGTHPRCR